MEDNNLGTGIDPTPAGPAANPTDNNPAQETSPADPAPPLNLAELLESNPELRKQYQTEVDKERRKASTTAAENERKRQQQLAAENLTRAEKEKLMKPEELAEMYRKEASDLKAQIARADEIRALTTEINEILETSKIPTELYFTDYDLFKVTAEEAKERALLLSKYEYFPKGEFEKKLKEAVEAGINAKLKQDDPKQPLSQNITSGMALKPTVIN